MDTNTPPTRTPAQTAASKANGATSSGPVTPAGKAISSANGTTHGLASRGVLLPSERAQDYESNLNSWFMTLVPRSPGEGQLVVRVADVGWRMGRLSRLEERMVNAALEKRLAESAPAKALQTAQEAVQAVRSVAVLAEEVTTPRPADGVAKIASGLKFVSQLLGMETIASNRGATIFANVRRRPGKSVLLLGVPNQRDRARGDRISAFRHDRLQVEAWAWPRTVEVRCILGVQGRDFAAAFRLRSRSAMKSSQSARSSSVVARSRAARKIASSCAMRICSLRATSSRVRGNQWRTASPVLLGERDVDDRVHFPEPACVALPLASTSTGVGCGLVM